MDITIVTLRDQAILPVYQTEHAAGMDLHACIDSALTLRPMQRMMVPTGIAIELPTGFEAQIRARSGLSIKHGITMVNGIGTIDSDYRGEVGVLVVNLSDTPFVIEPDMRIAQMVVARHEHVTWRRAQTLGRSERESSGYGSTGTDAIIDTST